MFTKIQRLYKKAEKILQVCEKNGADAILLMGDYSQRGIHGRTNFKTDFNSTKGVLNEFTKSRVPVYILSGSNDNLQDVKTIAKKHSRLVPLEDNVFVSIADLNVLPLNGYDNRNFMFEGANFVNPSDMDKYLDNLKKIKGNRVSVTHISPYGHTDRISLGVNVGTNI